MTVPSRAVAVRSEAIVSLDPDETAMTTDPDEGRCCEFDSTGTRVRALRESARSVAEPCEAQVGGHGPVMKRYGHLAAAETLLATRG